MKSDPLRPRSYLHFDERIPRTSLLKLVANSAAVAAWQFMPLLRATVKTKKIKTKDKKTGSFDVKSKNRPICYASHRDAGLYAFYAEDLTQRYEKVLAQDDLSENITAFRPATGKCNIHFAFEAFTWIDENRPCVALAYDVSKFFDTLDHAILKRKWCEVLGVPALEKDHFVIFRSLTKFTLVERDAVYALFGISKHKPKAFGRQRICSASDFREKIADAGMLIKNNDPYGIPQGTPISAVLSNIYMLDFDRSVAQKIAQWGGLYRRYCDDILCVVPPEFSVEAKEFIKASIHEVKLEIQEDKLDECTFGTSSLPLSKPLQYLGLTYDGVRVLLRSGGVGRYYGRMRAGVRNADVARTSVANKKGVAKSEISIRRKKLNMLYSYAGRRNFITYAHRAARITGQDAIKGQVSRHWYALNEIVKLSDVD